MPFVTMTKDFSEVKKPIAAGLTVRQLICFTIAGGIGIPVYLLTKDKFDTSIAVIFMMLAMLPEFFLAQYTKDGMPLEKHVMYFYETRFKRNIERPYKTQNIFDLVKKREEVEKEVEKILLQNKVPKKMIKDMKPKIDNEKIIIPIKGKIDRKTKKELEKAVKKAYRTGKIPESAQETIPYKRAYEDGIFESEDGYFTRTVAFDDVTYQLLDREDKERIFECWCDFLNYFDSTIHFQFSYYNQEVNKDKFADNFKIPYQDDAFNHVRKEYSDMQLSQLNKGTNDIQKERYLTFGIKADDYKNAKIRLEKISTAVQKNFMRFGCKSRVLDGYNRLKVLYHIFHPGTKENFLWNFDMPVNTGLSSKDFIAPSSFDFKFSPKMDASKYFGVGDRIGAAYYIKIMAEDMEDRIIADLLALNSSIMINVHADVYDQTKALKIVKNELADMQRMKVNEQKKAAQNGYDMDILPPDLVMYEEAAQRLVQDLQKKNERLFNATITVVLTAKNKKILDELEFECNGILSPYQCSLVKLDNRQEQGYMSALPLGNNSIDIKRSLTTTNKAIFIPFTTEELFTSRGQYYGMNALSNNIIAVTRKSLLNPNGLVFGKPGSGKTFFVKREILDVFLKTVDDIFIIDPEGEYRFLVRMLGGQVVRISVNSTNYINPMHINLEADNNEDKDYDPISAKCNFVISFCELILGNKAMLGKKEISVIDSCCQEIYAEYAQNPIPEEMPVLGDLYNALLARKGRAKEIGEDLAMALERYVTGSLSYFNHRTNVDIKNRIVCYDLKEMDKNQRDLAMLIVQESTWDRVAQNRGVKYTWVNIDEFHVLLRNPMTAAYSVDMWKRFRKWGGIPTGITQNVKDLFKSPEIQNILDTTDFIVMLNQAGDDARILADHLEISDDEMAYIKTGEYGKGLLFAGNTKIPFVDEFPRNTLSYKVMTTKPDEALTEKSYTSKANDSIKQSNALIS